MQKFSQFLFLLFLFPALLLGCATREEAVAPVSADLARTEVETVCEDDGALRSRYESTFDSSGSITKEQNVSYYENGIVEEFISTTYDENGIVTEYQKTERFENGIFRSLLSKTYADGILDQITGVTFYEDGRKRSTQKCNFDETGTEWMSLQESYFLDGSVQSLQTNVLDRKTGLRNIKYEENSESGTLLQLEDCVYDSAYEWIGGYKAAYYESGTVRHREERTFDAKTETHHRTTTSYYEDGSEESTTLCALQTDKRSNVVLEEISQHGAYHAFLEQVRYSYTYDERDRLAEQVHTAYAESGEPRRETVTTYEYDEAGKVVQKSETFFDHKGAVQSAILCEYSYDEAGNNVKTQNTVYFGSGVQMATWTEEYDADGRAARIVTTTIKGVTLTQTNTYTPDGKPLSEQIATERTSTKTITYRETSYEYHPDGSTKLISRHDWTSLDEIGKTIVMEFDEDGTRIR